MLVIYTGRSDNFLHNFHLMMSRTLSSCCFYSYASPNTKSHTPVNSKQKFSNTTLLNKAWRAKYCIDSKRSPIRRLSRDRSCRIMQWKSTWVFSSVAGRSSLLTDTTMWFTRLRVMLPSLKDWLLPAPISLKQLSPSHFIPFFVSISLCLCSSNALGEEWQDTRDSALQMLHIFPFLL